MSTRGTNVQVAFANFTENRSALTIALTSVIYSHLVRGMKPTDISIDDYKFKIFLNR